MPGMGDDERDQIRREAAEAEKATDSVPHQDQPNRLRTKQQEEFLQELHLRILADKGRERATQFYGEDWNLEQVRKARDDAGTILIELVQTGDSRIMAQFHFDTWHEFNSLLLQFEDQ